MKCDVLHRQQKFPERLRHFGIFAPRRQQKINREHGEIHRHDSQRAAGEKPAEFEALNTRKRGEQLAADQITAKDKEKIDTDPAEAVHSAGQLESEQCGMVNNDDDDRERAEKIEAGLAFAISKARIDFYFATVRLRRDGHQSYFGNRAKNLSVICASEEKSFAGYPGAHAAGVLISAGRRNTMSEVSDLHCAIDSVRARARGARR